MTTSVLERVEVEVPCTVAWDTMGRTSDDRVRFCGECRLQVWNLSGMSQGDAEELVRLRLGRGESVCARFVRRADGTLVTQDCGPVRSELRRRAERMRLVATGLAAMLVPAGLVALFFPVAPPEPVRPVTPVAPRPQPVAAPVPSPVPPPMVVVPQPESPRPAPSPTPQPSEELPQTPPASPAPAPAPPDPPERTFVGKLCMR